MLAVIDASTYVFIAFTEGNLTSDVPSKLTSNDLLAAFSFVPNAVVTAASFAFKAKAVFTSVIFAFNAKDVFTLVVFAFNAN